MPHISAALATIYCQEHRLFESTHTKVWAAGEGGLSLVGEVWLLTVKVASKQLAMIYSQWEHHHSWPLQTAWSILHDFLSKPRAFSYVADHGRRNLPRAIFVSLEKVFRGHDSGKEIIFQHFIKWQDSRLCNLRYSVLAMR